MPINWNAILQGVGQGTASLGQNLAQQRLIDDQQNRQRAQDAMTQLVTLNKLGASPIPQGIDPGAAVTQASDANHLRSGGAVPNSALGIDDSTVPDAYGSPTTLQLPGPDGKMRSFLVDPSKTPEALAERRMSLQQAGQMREAQARQQASLAMAGQERSRKIQQYVAAGVPMERAALYVDNPQLAENDPTFGKPVMAERTPKSVMLDGKPTELLFDKAGKAYDVNGKVVTGNITPYVAPPNPELLGMREDAIAQRKDAQGQRNEARLVSQYTEATKKYSQTADALQAINENRAGALKGDPVAQQTLLQDFIKLNLPGQQVTEGELSHYMHLMGLGEKGQQMLDKLRQGTPLGQQQIQLILQHADNLAEQRRQAHQYLREQYVNRGARSNVPPEAFPDWFGFLPPSGTKTTPPPAGGNSSSNINLGDTSANPFMTLPKRTP